MFATVLQVALGGALGASARYLAGVGVMRLAGPGFPFATLGVNILGSFLMGVFVVFAAERQATHLSPLLMTGMLGGFTTFSTFSLDAVTLLERGQTGSAALYVVASVLVSLVALFAGLMLARGIWA
ncbi:fluoride efflux transporter CrcB [Mesobaculum littorinae]|uniref:Fluoride-specific ion channel FluC n=1 Tax=Mesobaculum littorinae TaxID=2486419 RepID=A0A438AEI4_9RHOB|nr:fluoride efflux transporter CrcB [Mesobaculum littorinae]RVV97111.1 fluoride efflux transporter CrcB [Mesobaculum littorinae]